MSTSKNLIRTCSDQVFCFYEANVFVWLGPDVWRRGCVSVDRFFIDKNLVLRYNYAMVLIKEKDMKKIILIILSAMCMLSVSSGCANSAELVISIGDGMVENDSVSVQLKYGETWENGGKIFTVNYGHESNADLAEEYSLSFCDVDPMFKENLNLHTIFTFKKADLEDRSVSGGKFSGNEDEIVIEDLAECLPQGEGTCTAYLVLHSSDTDFSVITSFVSHEFTYEWQENGIKLI